MASNPIATATSSHSPAKLTEGSDGVRKCSSSSPSVSSISPSSSSNTISSLGGVLPGYHKRSRHRHRASTGTLQTPDNLPPTTSSSTSSSSSKSKSTNPSSRPLSSSTSSSSTSHASDRRASIASPSPSSQIPTSLSDENISHHIQDSTTSTSTSSSARATTPPPSSSQSNASGISTMQYRASITNRIKRTIKASFRRSTLVGYVCVCVSVCVSYPIRYLSPRATHLHEFTTIQRERWCSRGHTSHASLELSQQDRR